MTKKILITGGAGFIGSNFLRYIYNKYENYRIIVLDALTYAGSLENFPVNINETFNDRLEFWYGNVTNGELVDTLVSQADIVVHFAAETHVTRSIYDNYLFFQTDVIGTQTVANAVLKYRDQIERFIHISTSEVYGTAITDCMDENHPLTPMSPYAAAKVGADRLVYSYWATYEIPAVIVRPFNNYGPYQHLEKAIPRFITSCLLDENIRLHGDGSAARDYIHTDDTCEAIDLLIHAEGEKVHGETFNLATATHRSIKSIADDVVKKMGCDPAVITNIGDRPGQVFRHTGDFTKMSKMFGWHPKVEWDTGLERTIKWYADHVEWWKKQRWMRSVPIITKNGKREFH